MAMFDTPSSAHRPMSMDSSSSSDNNPFFDDMAYLEQVVEAPKKTSTKSKMKWGGRNKLKAESTSKSTPKVRAQRSMTSITSMASVQRPASPPASLFPVYSNATTSNSTARRPPSIAPSAYSAVSTAPPPVVSLSSDSESDGPGNFFDDISLLDTATSMQPKKKSKEKSKTKDRSKNGPMGKLRLLKSTTSLSSNKQSSDSASTLTARQSMSGSSGSSFTFTRSRTRSSSSRYSRSTVTSLTTVTTSAHTTNSDPNSVGRVQSPSSRSSPMSMKQSLPFPGIESLAPQLPPMNFPNSIASTSSGGSTFHTPSASISSAAPSATTSSPRRQPASLHPTPSQALQPVLSAQKASASPRSSPAPQLAPSPRSIPRTLPGPSPRGSPAPLAASPGPHASNVVPSPFGTSPQAFSSYFPVSAPINNTDRQRSASHDASARRMSNGWQPPAPTMSPRRQSLRVAQARKDSASSDGRKDSLTSHSSALNARRMSRMSTAESPCLSIIGHFPAPPEMELDGDRQLGPGSADHLVNSLTAVAEAASRGSIYEWRSGLDQEPPKRGSSVGAVGQREPSAAFLDEYMPFLTTPSPPHLDPLRVQVGDRSGYTPQEVTSRQEAQARGKDQPDPENPSEGTAASPTLLTPDAVVSSRSSLGGLSVPWAQQAGKRRSSASSLTVDREAARPESVILPDTDSLSSTQPSPSPTPALNRSRFADNDYISDSIDPLSRPPPSPSTLSVVSSYSTASGLSQESYPPPPPPPPQTTSGVDPDHAARRRTFGEAPSLPGMPIVYERGPNRARMGSASTVASSSGRFAHRQDSGASSYSAYSALSSGLSPRAKRQDSAASAFSIGANMSPTIGSFQTTDTAPLRIHRERSGSGAQRAGTRGPTAPLNITPARQRTISGASSDSSYAMPSHYSSLSSSYESGPGARFMTASAEVLPNARFNMSGHDVTRLRTISSGDKTRPVAKQAPSSALPAPPTRRPSGGSPHIVTPPSPLTQHTSKAHAPSSFVAPPLPVPSPANTAPPGVPSRGGSQNGTSNARRPSRSGSQSGGRPTVGQIHQTQVSASGGSFISMPGPKSPNGSASATKRGPVSPRRTPISPPRSIDVVEHPSHSNSYNHWAPSSPRSRGTPF